MVDRLAEEVQFPDLLTLRDGQEIFARKSRAADNDHGRYRGDRYQPDDDRTLSVFSKLFEIHPHPVPSRPLNRRRLRPVLDGRMIRRGLSPGSEEGVFPFSTRTNVLEESVKHVRAHPR